MRDGLGQNEIVRVGKNSGAGLSRLWTKVHETLGQRRRPFVLSSELPDCLCHVSFSRYSPLSFKIVEKPNKCKFLTPILREERPQFLYGILLAGLPSTVWQSLAEFHFLIAVCEAWQWSRMQNLRRVAENSLPIWSRLWTKVHVVSRRCRRPLVGHLCIPYFIPRTQVVKFVVELRSRPRNVVLGPLICRGREYPWYWTCVFKLHLLPTMWPDMVKFRSVSSEIRRRKKKESVVKYKSVDMYVGRPNYRVRSRHAVAV